MKVCPQSPDGCHHYIEKGAWALCLICLKEITIMGITDKWVKE
jgi:hypothetical protein